MDVSRETTDGQTVIRVDGECTIYHAADLKPLLLEDTRGLDRDVVLDLEQVRDLDCAGVQLLLMLQRQVAAAGGELRLQAISESVQQVLRTLRLPSPFNAGEAAR